MYVVCTYLSIVCVYMYAKSPMLRDLCTNVPMHACFRVRMYVQETKAIGTYIYAYKIRSVDIVYYIYMYIYIYIHICMYIYSSDAI